MIIKPGSADLPAALAEATEMKDLLEAMQRCRAGMSPVALQEVCSGMDNILTARFPGARLDFALAVVCAFAARETAALLMQVQASEPVSVPEQDGRVKAVASFIVQELKRSIGELQAVSKADAGARALMGKIGGRAH